ncbi:glycosyltransferase family 4 protein [Patescibacteria group bacterium]|nr:glycosyltransferase family 4 protein [Patescibacteria group bacterium]
MKLLVITEFNPEKLGGAEMHASQVLKRIRPKFSAVIVPKIYHFFGPNFSWIFYMLFATPVIFWETIRSKPDLLWATLDFPQAQVGAVIKVLTSKPLYVTSQNPLLGEEEFVGLGGKLVKYLVSFAFARADVVAAVSTYSANLAKKLGAKKVVIIPNGV